MWADNYWKSKELYKEVSRVIPGFENLEPGQDIFIKDQKGNLSYKVIAKPLPTLDDSVSGIVIGGKPDSRITMATREVAKVGLRAMFGLFREAFKAVNIDLEAITKNDFDLYLQNIKTGENIWLRVNHKQEKVQGMLTFLVDYDKEGNITDAKENWGGSRHSPEEIIRSEEFKSNFTSLHQNIKN